MAKRVSFDLAELTAEAAEPMKEAVQRIVAPPSTGPAPASIEPPSSPSDSMTATATADLEQLAFKVPPEFRRRFRQAALGANLKLNQLLFEALDAWEEKQK